MALDGSVPSPPGYNSYRFASLPVHHHLPSSSFPALVDLTTSRHDQYRYPYLRNTVGLNQDEI
ncbi:hypothetical protein Hypma_014025 [Hypsizygus marmoreus]|uniref:Uncharacterized protein n=1 Tax=Hypsizygus marmoreus TaxID=39966 RepID=A0A369K8E4_HYPMA|nr:hypothetical protein Hypma_014025 [Hypsizygus marmoreus]